MTEDERKHLEFIEAIVARLGSNSFLVKGWSVTLAAALMAISANQANPVFAEVGLLPAFTFWGLDAFYLHKERAFRRLYDDVRQQRHMPLGPVEPFTMERRQSAPGFLEWLSAVKGLAVGLFHVSVIVSLVAVIVVLRATS